MELRHDPKYAKGIKALVKKKEEDIASLRKQLKLPPSRHPQIAEIIEQKLDEDMMDLLIKLNERLTDIEQALEKSLKEKQGEQTSQPPEVIPIVTTIVPSTIGSALAPNVPAITTQVIIGKSSTRAAPSSSTNMSIEELIKAMEELKLQVSQLKLVKDQLAKAERNYDISKINVVEKTKEIKALESKVKTLEQELTFDKPLAEIRKILWANITQSINEIWPSIQVIYEQIGLINTTHEVIQQTRVQLGKMPEEANQVIHFLNTHNA